MFVPFSRYYRRMPKNVLSDSKGVLMIYKSSKDYPIKIRKVEYRDDEQNRKFVILTNAFDLPHFKLLYSIRTDGRLSYFSNG